MNKLSLVSTLVAAAVSLSSAASAQTYSVEPKNTVGTLSGWIDLSQTLPRATCALNALSYSIGNAASSNTAATTSGSGTPLCTNFPLNGVTLKNDFIIRATGPNQVSIDRVYLNSLWPNTCGSLSTSLTGTIVSSTTIKLDPATIPGTTLFGSVNCIIYDGEITVSGGIWTSNP